MPRKGTYNDTVVYLQRKQKVGGRGLEEPQPSEVRSLLTTITAEQKLKGAGVFVAGLPARWEGHLVVSVFWALLPS